MLQQTQLHALDRCAVQHRSHFLATARRVLGDPAAAQDAVQDAMLSAARNLHRFRGDSQLSTWLGRIVINAALTRRRALRRRPEESLDALLERDAPQGPRSHQRQGNGTPRSPAPAPSQERTLLRAEITSMLRSAVDRLPNDYRTVVIMRHYEDHRDRGDCVAAADHAECRETSASARAPRAAQPAGGARVRHHDPIGIGARLGPYEILGPIGRGGMGEVYRARDARLGREVAVKVLPADADQMPDLLPRFEREAQAVAALNHPNILALHDIGNDAGVVYAVMELLEGDTLRVRLEQAKRFTPLKAIDYAIQIARGLAAAHERGIVHRDLKPENIFITHDGRVKILDFGLAQQETTPAGDGVSRDTRFTTEPGVLLGTPGYTAPEQILGEPATVRSDLFALGIVLYEMLTGAHPFRRRDDHRHGRSHSSRGSAVAGHRRARPAGGDREDRRAVSRQAPDRSAGLGPGPRTLPRSGRLGQRAAAGRPRDRPRRAAARAESHSGDLVRAADPAVHGHLGLRARHGGSGGHVGDRGRPDAGRTARPAGPARQAGDAGADRAPGRVVSRAQGALRDRRRDRSRLPRVLPAAQSGGPAARRARP